jgi:hypothetical protein
MFGRIQQVVQVAIYLPAAPMGPDQPTWGKLSQKSGLRGEVASLTALSIVIQMVLGNP